MEDTIKTINIYADESRHIDPNDSSMVIGALWLEKENVKEFSDKIRLLKKRYNIPAKREIKWAKVSGSKKEYYLDLIRLFFDYEAAKYRAIIIPKDKVVYDKCNGEFYYKALYMTLANITRQNVAKFRIYVDYKDSWSHIRSKELVKFLTKDHRNPSSQYDAQPIRSNESLIMQLSDLITGAVGMANNEYSKVEAKRDIAELLATLANQELTAQTPYNVDKFNLFKWHAEGWDK
ncbi:hypothetical protein FACS1894132_02130 [Clostridia bacterium]|nr:hypothetical protein FACS1894132_02130 [Clostridia bacterium]